MAEFTDTELAKFAILVGMPTGALQAVMKLNIEYTRSNVREYYIHFNEQNFNAKKCTPQITLLLPLFSSEAPQSFVKFCSDAPQSSIMNIYYIPMHS